MKRSFEKIAIVAQISIGAIFVLFVIFIPLGVLEVGLFDNSLVKILLGILTVLFVLLSVYILVATFTSSGALKRLLLFSDAESKTMTTAKVIRRLVINEGRKIKGIYVKKIHIRQDDKYGFNLRVTVGITGNDVEESVDTLRCMIADSFYNGLGVRFNSIDFIVKNLKTKYVADLKRAQAQAKNLKEKRGCSKQYIHDAIEPIYDEKDIKDIPEKTDGEKLEKIKEVMQEGPWESRSGKNEFGENEKGTDESTENIETNAENENGDG
ncbi:MAG TPA: hypothetical protein PK675_00540 [Clostridia bacterium]|nr:hypothetical protein [Clostridia bacterium]